MKVAVNPGSARFQRVGFGILPKRTFCGVSSDGARIPHSTRQKVRDGGTPSPTRWKRALPGVLRAASLVIFPC